MSITLTQIAGLVGGRLSGDGGILITGASTIRDARAGDITLADDAKLLRRLDSCQASAVLVPRDVEPGDRPYITVDDVHKSFAIVVGHFRAPRPKRPMGISPQAYVSPTARIAPDVDIHPFATIGDEVEIGPRSVIHSGARLMAGCRIGQDAVIYPNAVLYENTIVGDRTLIHAGAVIGAYGFGYETFEGRHVLSAQLGYVEIGADVDIGAGTTIDRGTYDATVIGEGTKIDDQVMIGHNCRIGRHNVLCSQVGIAGSCTTGDYVVMAGQVGVRDHVDIGDGATLGAKAGVKDDLPGGRVYLGAPAIPEREQMHVMAAFGRLPEMRRQLKSLQRTVESMTRVGETNAARDPARNGSE